MDEIKKPTAEEIKQYLTDYGWNYKETEAGEDKVILAPYITTQNQGVLISFQVQGEFVMVTTIGLLKNVPNENAKDLLMIADRIKLVKIYAVDDAEEGKINADVGFELWAEAWNQRTFFAFMDAIGMGIERVLQRARDGGIPFETNWVNLGQKSE